MSTNVLLQGGSIDLEQQCLQMYCCKTVQLTWNSSVYKCIHTQRPSLYYYLQINIFEPAICLNYVQEVNFYPAV